MKYWKTKICGRIRGQATIEFTFSMVLVVLLILGLIKIFAWTGEDLVERRIEHERVLTQGICQGQSCPLQQITPDFFSSAEVGASVDSNIFRQ